MKKKIITIGALLTACVVAAQITKTQMPNGGTRYATPVSVNQVGAVLKDIEETNILATNVAVIHLTKEGLMDGFASVNVRTYDGHHSETTIRSDQMTFVLEDIGLTNIPDASIVRINMGKANRAVAVVK